MQKNFCDLCKKETNINTFKQPYLKIYVDSAWIKINVNGDRLDLCDECLSAIAKTMNKLTK